MAPERQRSWSHLFDSGAQLYRWNCQPKRNNADMLPQSLDGT